MCQATARLVICLAQGSCCLRAIVLMLEELGCDRGWGLDTYLLFQFKAYLAGSGRASSFSAGWYSFHMPWCHCSAWQWEWWLPGKPQAIQYPNTVLRCSWPQHQRLDLCAYVNSGFLYLWLSCSRDQFLGTENTTFSGITVRIWVAEISDNICKAVYSKCWFKKKKVCKCINHWKFVSEWG